MKKSNLIFSVLLLAFLTLFTMVSCSDDDPIPIVDIELNTKELTLTEKGTSGIINVLKGNGAYSVTSSDKKIATASIITDKETQKTTISVTPVSAGTATITLVDAADKKSEITVLVKTPDVAIEKSLVNLLVDEIATIKILAGSSEYEISVNNSNATAEIVGMDIKITGKVLGESEVTLTDIKTKKTAVITVKITPAPELTLDKEKVEFILTQTGTVTILTGTAPFTIEDKYSWASTTSTFKIVNEQGEEDVNGSKIIFDSTKETIDSYKITDAKLKEIDFDVKVFKALSVSETALEIPKGKIVEITLEGKIDAIEVSSTNSSVVTAEIKDEYGSSSRTVMIKTAQVGSAELTFTDGVTTQKVTVTVVAPNPLAIFNDDVEVNTTTVYELGSLDLILQGGIGEYEVTFSKENILTFEEIQQSPLDDSKYYLKLKRNFSVRQAGEVVVTVSRKDDATDSKSFTVKYKTLIAASIKINGVDVIQKESSEYGMATPYFTANQEKSYDVYVAVGTTVDFEILNNPSVNCTIDASGYGSDRGEITGDATKFSVKTLKSGNYYVSITNPEDEQVLLVTVRIE
ncbi:hypothetical protein [Tenacibaculum finnmarkense]|uniref:hypothetical protein n=1 Tax=Tenacibaculum finnmarkense TaxID=2781243 RepID=UPI001EFB1623|nr:hypothetical protein [Tenacibaculum finnmarkense]MCG8802032.1 hypothetical protein [Tenacibaculum finnmarkense]MCG8824761.1 hypothetical protein [Tenacibaculum finnmarkense]